MFVDDAVAAYHGVVTFGDKHLGRRLAGIENDNNVTPFIATSVVLQTVGYGALRGIDKLQVLAHKVGIAQAEGWVILAQLDKVLVILKNLRILDFVGPVELIDAIG